jgi:glutamate-1-semialdehyde 2,1-aminomutase
MAYGPLIFGHAPRFVSSAVVRQLRRGTVYGTPSCHEIRLAEDVKRAYSSISLIRFVNSGQRLRGAPSGLLEHIRVGRR